PLHALAVPDADPTTLLRPEEAAAEIVRSLLAALPSQAAPSGRGAPMIGAKRPDRRSAKLLTLDASAGMLQLPRVALASLFSPGDLVIANDAATLPASLKGIHCASGEPIEVWLAAWVSIRDPTRFAAIAFGGGDHRTPTEDRMLPPSLSPGDRLT